MQFRILAAYSIGFISGGWISSIYVSKYEFKHSYRVMQCMDENFQKITTNKK